MASLQSTNNQLPPSRIERQQTRESPAKPSPRRRTRKRGRAGKAADDFYSVKSILDESDDRYLIDWEDDSITGRSYSPTWVRLHCDLISTVSR